MINGKKKKKIIVGICVETIKKPSRSGVVVESIAGYRWNVKMDDNNEKISFSSNQLRITELMDPIDILNGEKLKDLDNTSAAQNFPSLLKKTSTINENSISKQFGDPRCPVLSNIKNLPLSLPQPVVTINWQAHESVTANSLQSSTFPSNVTGQLTLNPHNEISLSETSTSNFIYGSAYNNTELLYNLQSLGIADNVATSNSQAHESATANSLKSSIITSNAPGQLTLNPNDEIRVSEASTSNFIQGSTYDNTELLYNFQSLGIADNVPDLLEASYCDSTSIDSYVEDLDLNMLEDEDSEYLQIFDDEIEDLEDNKKKEEWENYLKEKTLLIESKHTIPKSRPGKRGESQKKYFWKAAVNKSGTKWRDYDDVQLRDFDFENIVTNKTPYGEMYLRLYPADDWKKNLARLNKRIESYNNGRRVNIGRVTEKEWWTFHALILTATQIGSSNLYPKVTYGLCSSPNLSQYMTESRFRDIRSNFEYAFYDEYVSQLSEKEYLEEFGCERDPWYKADLLINEFNSNRKIMVATSCKKVLDESMSQLEASATKNGKVPKLTFCPRKPRPLGIEFKVATDAVTGCMLHLEIQKGKDPMQKAVHYDEYGATTACSLRLMEASAGTGQMLCDRKKELFLADSWFASVKTADAIKAAGHAFVGPVKTNSSGFPGNEIATIMKSWPAGSSIVFEAEDEMGNSLGLNAVGYKYRKKSSLHFIMTSDAGGTTDGVDYSATYTDDDGVRTTRNVRRPAVLSAYFQNSNSIDRHNQLRQGNLQLETLWPTQSPWFRILTTVAFGMTVTDAFLLGKKSVDEKHPLKTMTVNEFAAAVASDLVNMTCFKTTLSSSSRFIPRLDQNLIATFNGPDSLRSVGTTFSFESDVQNCNFGDLSILDMQQCVAVPNGAPILPSSVMVGHSRGTYPLGNFNSGSQQRPLRKNCEYRSCKVRTQYFCIQCRKSYCCDESSRSNVTGRHCFYAHICEIQYNKSSAQFKKTIDKWNQEREKK